MVMLRFHAKPDFIPRTSGAASILPRCVRAVPAQAELLSRIAVAAKQHWRYPREWMDEWRSDLTLTAEYIQKHETYIAMHSQRAVGFAAWERLGEDAVLEHCWVLPEMLGRGMGSALFACYERAARTAGAKRLRIVADPHAEPFYHRMGAHTVSRQRTEVGREERWLPVLEKKL